MQNKHDKEKLLGQWHNSLQKLKSKAQAYSVLPGVPSGTSTLIELFLLNYFKESTDNMTYHDLVNLLTESIPGRNLFKNMLLAGAAWSCGGVETQSKGQIKRKYLKKFQSTRNYVIDHDLLGFFTVKNTLYVSKLKDKNNVATVMHELTHGLCNAIYQNDCKPYYATDDTQSRNWQEYIESVLADLETYVLALQQKIQDKTAATEEIREYQLYSTFVGFKINGYAEREFLVEAIAHLVQAVVYQDIDDVVKLSPRTKILATQLLKRFTMDCAAWSVAILQDIGLDLIEDPLICRNRGSEVERVRAGNFSQSGLFYCSAAQAEILNTAISCHKPIVDMWLDKIFQFIMTDHWREGTDKYDMRKQYHDYYTWLEQLTSETQQDTSQDSKEETLQKRLFFLWNQALEQQRVSLNGLFEAIVRYFNRLPEEKSDGESIEACFKVYFNLVDIHAKEAGKFDYTRAAIFISRHYSPRYYQVFFELAAARFAQEANFFNESILFWLGASGHPALVDAIATMPHVMRNDFESTLKSILHGAICYGKTQLVELLAQRYHVGLARILQPKTLLTYSATIIHYGHVGILEVLCHEIPVLRGCLIPIYLCIADKKSLSFARFLKKLNIADYITAETTDYLIDLLCKKGFYKELEQLIEFIAYCKPECLNLNERRDVHKIQQFIAQNDLKAFEIMAQYTSERMCKDYFLNNILHTMVLFNRYEFAVALKVNHPDTFDRLVADKNAESQTPFDYAMVCGDFQLAGLFSMEGLIGAVNQNKITPDTLPRSKSKTASEEVVMLASMLATAGKHYEKSLTILLDVHPIADLTHQLEFGNTLLHYAALYNLPSVAKKILDRFADMHFATNIYGETAVSLAMKKGHVEAAVVLCHHQLQHADQTQVQSLLCEAVMCDCLAVFQKIISKHPDLLHFPVRESYLNIARPTIAMLAAMAKSHTILGWVKHRAGQIENFGDYNPLILLTLNDESKNIDETLQQILASGGDELFTQDRSGRHPMLFAACASLEICKTFYQYHPNFNVQDANGDSSLHYAINSGKTENAKFLVDTCRVEQVSNNNGLRPIHLAAARGSCVLITILQAFPEEINVLTQDANSGKSPLVIAITNGREKAAMYLLSHGADLNYPGYSTSDLIKLATNHAMHALAKAIFNKSITFEHLMLSI